MDASTQDREKEKRPLPPNLGHLHKSQFGMIDVIDLLQGERRARIEGQPHLQVCVARRGLHLELNPASAFQLSSGEWLRCTTPGLAGKMNPFQKINHLISKLIRWFDNWFEKYKLISQFDKRIQTLLNYLFLI